MASLPLSLDLTGLLPDHELAALEQAVINRPSKALRRRPAAAVGGAERLPLPFPSEPVPWYPDGCFCPETHQPGRFLHHAAGDYFIQDAGSMLALRLLAPQPTEWIADVCAAPGGKASAILEIVGPGGGFLLANEPIHGRLPPLEFTLARVGFPRFVITARDPENLEPLWGERFNAVLVDAPCTGQSLVGRGKQSAFAFSADRVAHAAARQRRILTAAAALVQPGGRLVYSTCTFATAENEQVINDFLQHHPSWRVEPVAGLETWMSPREPGGYRLYPHRDRCAGAYAVLLRRDGESLPPTPPRAAAPDDGFEPLTIADDVVGSTRCGVTIRWKRRWEEWPHDIARLVDSSTARCSEIAYLPRKHWMPAHALALRRDSNWMAATTLTLDDTTAARYVQGLALPAGPAGWCVATWRGHPLGWLRGTHERCNNGLPATARLGFVPVVHAETFVDSQQAHRDTLPDTHGDGTTDSRKSPTPM
jgi:16S rRNA C967 or C1407 C5-methylase (RsmB/RsmF family)/NOL1/NOP2/fmu family ribosome biogenesis protein